MTTTAVDVAVDVFDLEPETPAQVLACLGEAQDRVDAGEVDKLRMAVAWAAMHSVDSLVPATREWQEGTLPLAGEGAPEVAEFCVAELAAVLGISTDAGAQLLGDAVELAHRLPRLWSEVLAGRVRAWRARRVAQQTRTLSPAAAAFVDTHVAPVAAGIGPAALTRVIDAAIAHHDPAAFADRTREAADHRRVQVHFHALGSDGTVDVLATLDAADARDVDDAVSRRAAQLGRLGSVDSMDVRRAIALGDLARADLVLDLITTDTDGTVHTAKARQVVVHVHLADAGVARMKRGRKVVSVEQVQGWCRAPGTWVVIKPVIDLTATPHVEAYEIPDRIRDQVFIRDLTCVFPWCSRPSRAADLDHIQPWEPGDSGGATSPPNLAPLCRRHHRHKTHSRWRYRRTGPTTYEWASPHGHTFTVYAGLTRPGAAPCPDAGGLDDARP